MVPYVIANLLMVRGSLRDEPRPSERGYRG